MNIAGRSYFIILHEKLKRCTEGSMIQMWKVRVKKETLVQKKKNNVYLETEDGYKALLKDSFKDTAEREEVQNVDAPVNTNPFHGEPPLALRLNHSFEKWLRLQNRRKEENIYDFSQ